MLRKYHSRPAPERHLLLRAVGVVTLVRLGLWLLPFGTLDRLLSACVRSSRYPTHSLDQLVWAVRAASARIPCASCLTQSLALHYLLARSGHPSRIHIGVAKAEGGEFRAHAWVESNGRILLNSPAEVAQYARLTSWTRFAQ